MHTYTQGKLKSMEDSLAGCAQNNRQLNEELRKMKSLHSPSAYNTDGPTSLPSVLPSLRPPPLVCERRYFVSNWTWFSSFVGKCTDVGTLLS